MHIYIYMLAGCEVIIWSKFGLLRGYYLVQVCFFKFTACQNTMKYGVSTHLFLKKKLHANISGVIRWSKFAFLKRTQLGPDDNPNLDQINNPSKCILFASLDFEHMLRYLMLQSFLNINQMLEKCPPPK